MATNPVREYLDALESFEKATEKVTRLIEQVTDAASKLRDWRHIIITGVSNFPGELVLDARTPMIDARGWPSIEEISRAILEWHQLRHGLENMWQRVPQADRRHLQSPPK